MSTVLTDVVIIVCVLTSAKNITVAESLYGVTF